jgi:hypothetical protein
VDAGKSSHGSHNFRPKQLTACQVYSYTFYDWREVVPACQISCSPLASALRYYRKATYYTKQRWFCKPSVEWQKTTTKRHPLVHELLDGQHGYIGCPLQISKFGV